MEYIIFLTYRCNLRCSYCFASNVVFHNESDYSLSSQKTNQIIEFIKRDIFKRRSEDNSIVFFGGEPTLVPGIINEIINNTKGLGLRYSIYTNGLLLDLLPQHILDQLNSILVAIDGDKKTHELYKPVGSFDKIINNVSKVRNNFNGELIARITMEEETDIFWSVTNLLNEFDFVHWQIVNKPYFNDPLLLIKRYEKNIKKLYDYWINALSHGNIYNIIPFNEIMTYILSNQKVENSFWCGCGKSVMAIDINGKVYQCDEYINRPNSCIGSIDDQDIILKYSPHSEICTVCRNCSISSICLGRCKKSLETLPLDNLQVYCSLTKILINQLCSNARDFRVGRT